MQFLVHAGLLLVSLVALPIYPGASWKPSGPDAPALHIIALLAVSVGLPYFLLSTTGPLLQAWYARSHKGAMPYRLYALSNAGSMFALLSYPVLFEPIYATHQQAVIWSFAYVSFAALCAFTALRSSRAPLAAALEAEAESAERPTVQAYALWLLLPACASMLLLAISTHLRRTSPPYRSCGFFR